MKSPGVEMYVCLDLPSASVRSSLFAVIAELREHAEPYKQLEFAFKMPMVVEIGERPERWECELHLRAARAQRFFPTFDGTLSVTPLGENACELWLQGSYTPPGGRAGKLLDDIALHGIAERSLRRFVEEIAAGLKREVAKGPPAPEEPT